MWKQPKYPLVDEQIKKCVVVHTTTYNVILLNHKKEQNFAICSNLDGLGRHYLSGISQTRTNIVRYHLYMDHLYVDIV